MQRPKHDSNRRENIFNPEFSPKIPAKKPNLRKKILGGQQSAQHGRRADRQNFMAASQLCSLSQQQIRQSAIYRLLEQEIKLMSNRHQIQLNKMRQIKSEREKQVTVLQKEQYQTKVQIWQLKNEVLDLKQSIKQEKEETLRLMGELGIEDDGENANQPQG